MADPYNRNPLIIPELPVREGPPGRRCPVCGSQDFTGNKSGESLTFKCRSCNNVWGGGLPREQTDLRRPLPPTDPRDRPSIEFALHPEKKTIEEIRRPVDMTPDYRRGAFIPPEEDDEYGW